MALVDGTADDPRRGNSEVVGVPTVAGSDAPGSFDELDLDGHALVMGYGGHAIGLCATLEGAGVPFVVVTLSPDAADHATSLGWTVVLADVTDRRTLQLLGVDRAQVAVVAGDDEAARASLVVAALRDSVPDLPIVVRVPDPATGVSFAAEHPDLCLVEDQVAVGEVLADRVLGTRARAR